MGMYDSIKFKKPLPLPKELEGLDINWLDHSFQTKDLDNCLSEYFISSDGFLYEHIIEREYIPFTEEEKKDKQIKPWNLWKDVVEKNSFDKKIETIHGKIRFYTYENFDEKHDFWVEFDAYFIYGKFDKVELVEFKKETSRAISNQKFIEEMREKQKRPWPVFKRWASLLGWRYFWRATSNGLYKLSRLCSQAQHFILKHLL